MIGYIWVPFIFGGICTILYILISKRLFLVSIKSRLVYQPASSTKKNTPKKHQVDPFGLFMLPIKNKLALLTPVNIKRKLEAIINLSGIKYQLGDIILLKILLFLSICLLMFAFIQNSEHKLLIMMLGVCGGTLGFMMPDVIIGKKAKNRQNSVKKTIPPFIDYLTISVEAGLGLDLAISRVIKQLEGPLAEELANTLTEIKWGKHKREAFKDLAAKINIAEFTGFLTSIINGEQFGVSLSNILKVQSQQMREKKKQKIQEEAYKIPVKLVFPLVMFIFPGMFIVILGPAVVQIMTTLLK